MSSFTSLRNAPRRHVVLPAAALALLGCGAGSHDTTSRDAAAESAPGVDAGTRDGAPDTGVDLPSGDSSSTSPADAGSTPDSGGPSADGSSESDGGAGALIQNDVFWKDTSGNVLYSQGGGVLQVGSTFYWYGIQYGGAPTYASKPSGKNSNTAFTAVTCYSSTDLASWKFENDVLTAASIGATGWVGRIGAAYNATTKNYVLVMQYTGTNGAGELFATSPTPTGDFTFNNVQTTLTNVTNGGSGDQSIFNDDDGQAYLVLSNEDGRSNLYVAPLRPADFLAVEPATQIYASSAGGREGNCMYKYGGYYYFNSSDLHGWNASHTYYISATNILGPYSAEAILGNTDADFSHVTQTGLFVTVHGSAQTTVIFGGDRWSDFAGNGIGFNQWVPLTFSGTTAEMQSMSQWSIDATTGRWSVGPGNNYALNPSIEADRVSVTEPAGWTTGGAPSANASGGHTGNWKWALSSTAAYTSSLTQSITGLTNGTYTLAAWIESSGGQPVAQLFAKGYGGAEVDASVNTAIADWSQITIPGIAVTSGTCQIGVQTTASATQWLDVDDFTFIKD